MDLQRIADALNRNGFQARVFATAAEAKAAVLEMIPAGADAGVGGSVTVQQLGLAEALSSKGCPVHWHWLAPQQERREAMRRAHAAQFYLMSSNAVTEDGELVNIDGTCNRLGTMLYGPGTVILLCGRNKVVADAFQALDRIHTVACPQNARRLNLSTPCAVTGRCADCRSPQRMCSAVVRLMRPAGSRAFHVMLIDEDLGY